MNLHFPGNDRVRRQLERALGSGRLARSYLFEGAAGAGQEQAAVELAAGFIVGDTALDNADARRVRRYAHPDLHYLLPALKPAGKAWGNMSSEEILAIFRAEQGKKADDPYYLPQPARQPHIPIEVVRQFCRTLANKPFEGRGKVLIIRDADEMWPEAQDTLLKTLEEPHADTLLILISAVPEALRPTILSRCQRVPFDPLERQAVESILTERGLDASRARFIATLSEGNLELALQLAGAESDEGNALLQQREAHLSLLDRCEFGSELEMMDALQSFVRQGAKSNPARARADFLSLAVSWYRELLRLTLEPGSARVHVDQAERLKRYEGLSREGLLDRIRSCEKARRQILSNAHAELTFLTLFFSFRAGKAARRSA